MHYFTFVAVPTIKMEKSWVKRCWSHSVKMGHLENWKGCSTKLISRNDKNSLKADKTVFKNISTLAHLKPHFNKYITLQNHSCWRDWCLPRKHFTRPICQQCSGLGTNGFKKFFQDKCEMTFQSKWFKRKIWVACQRFGN